MVERNVMRLILFIVVIITALNIITGVLMLVKNKARDVAILRTIGATRARRRAHLHDERDVPRHGWASARACCSACSAPSTSRRSSTSWKVCITGTQLFPRDIYMLDALPAQAGMGARSPGLRARRSS